MLQEWDAGMDCWGQFGTVSVCVEISPGLNGPGTTSSAGPSQGRAVPEWESIRFMAGETDESCASWQLHLGSLLICHLPLT